MSSTDIVNRIYYEILMGYEWGDPNSQIELTIENKEHWEKITLGVADLENRGIIPEMVNEMPDLSDYE